MGTLYIIGNGLDLYFGLKTKTEHFIEFLKKQQIYNEFENALDVFNSYGMNWGNYEQSLNDIDLDEIELRNEIYPDYSSDHEYDRSSGIVNMQMYVDSLSESINEALQEMVDKANDDIAHMNYQKNPNLFKSGDAILTFNYTSTLEYLFDIPADVPIYHIHGCYENGEPLIFGYKKDANSHRDSWTNIGIVDMDFYICQQREIVYSFYCQWEKELQLDGLNQFLSRCSYIDHIVVLGHSMSSVDAEYMTQVEKSICPYKWNISYFDGGDICRIELENYSFNDKIEFFKLETLV